MNSFELNIQNNDDVFFVPKLCESRALLSLVIMGELFILIIVLAEPLKAEFNWERFGLLSLFVQWIVLLSAGLICRLRPYLTHRSPLVAGAICCAGIVSLTLLFTQIAAFSYYPTLFDEEPLLHTSLRFGLISFIVSALILRYFYLISIWQQQKQAELTARVAALQARIQPHFLFNSLNSIVSLIGIDPDKAEQAVLDLADLFRASLVNSDRLSCWSKELELAKRYLSIEQFRLGNRLTVEWNLEAINDDFPVPHLTLQPLLENAIVHGIQPLLEGGDIVISAYTHNNFLSIEISNPCSAVPRKSSGNQMALSNLQARLTAYFGPSAKLVTQHQPPRFIATLSYPATAGTNHD